MAAACRASSQEEALDGLMATLHCIWNQPDPLVRHGLCAFV
jgi:hypothetical protein